MILLVLINYTRLWILWGQLLCLFCTSSTAYRLALNRYLLNEWLNESSNPGARWTDSHYKITIFTFSFFTEHFSLSQETSSLGLRDQRAEGAPSSPDAQRDTIPNKFWSWLLSGFPGGSAVQSLSECRSHRKMWVQSLGWEDPLEKGMATLSSILAWRIPWTERGASQATVYEVTKSRTRLK